jgi:hypothetical protein
MANQLQEFWTYVGTHPCSREKLEGCSPEKDFLKSRRRLSLSLFLFFEFQKFSPNYSRREPSFKSVRRAIKCHSSSRVKVCAPIKSFCERKLRGRHTTRMSYATGVSNGCCCCWITLPPSWLSRVVFRFCKE